MTNTVQLDGGQFGTDNVMTFYPTAAGGVTIVQHIGYAGSDQELRAMLPAFGQQTVSITVSPAWYLFAAALAATCNRLTRCHSRV